MSQLLEKTRARGRHHQRDEETAPRAPAHLSSALRSESALFLLGIAAVILYVLDDAFVHREPGTSASDHFLSGTVPVAILVAAALAYRRLRAGLRAALALGVGLTALAAGIAVPLRHIVIDRASGDDYTGVLSTVGGLLLVLLGGATLWRSRRLDEPRPRRYLRRLLLSLVAAVGAIFLVAPVVVSFAITHKARAPVAAADLGRSYQAVAFRTSDGLKLAGWYVPSRNGAAVIVFPGRRGTVRHARMLARHGYGVLLFDRRGEGESEGDFNALGWGGDKDLLAAIAFLKQRPDFRNGRIGGLGLSVGGELMLQTAAETDDLKAIVSEGAGMRSIKEALEMPNSAEKWLFHVAAHAVVTPATAVFANEAPPPNLKSLTPRIAPRPLFLIRARSADEQLNEKYYDVAGQPKLIWAIPEASHIGGLSARPHEYERRVVAFFDRALHVER